MKTKIILALTILLLGLSCLPRISLAYEPPKGIPDPADYFGFEIDRSAPNVSPTNNPKCTGWPSAGTPGCYWIDNTNSKKTCSDTSNPNGYPDKPRCSPPPGYTNFPAGSIIYFDGGTYANSIMNWYGAGTSADPIWVMGNPSNRPVFERSFLLSYQAGSSSYFIFDNLNFIRKAGSSYQTGLSLRPVITGGGNMDHILVRNCTFRGLGISPNFPNAGDSGDGSAIGIGAGTGTVNYVVIYNVDISNYGYIGSLGVGGEETGVYKDYSTDYAWVLNSTIHHVGADSVAGSHSATVDRPTEHYFIGGNTLYGNGENGIDLKSVNYAVISENEIYGPFQDEQGGGIVLHYGANSIYTKNAWVIFNKIHNISSGMGLTGGENMYAIGNILWNVSMSYGAQYDPYYNGCIFSSTAGKAYIIDNTCYDYDWGIKIINSNLSSANDIQVSGNILSTRKPGSTYSLYVGVSTGRENAHLDYNRIYEPGATAAVYYGGQSSLAQVQAQSNCVHCSEGDPGLANPPSSLQLRSGSASIDANIKHAAYDLFAAEYPGYSIDKDFNGVSRPQGSAWDIGAYEYSGGGGDVVAPTAPSGLQVM